MGGRGRTPPLRGEQDDFHKNVIPRSEATWESVFPCVRGAAWGYYGLPHQPAGWFAMTGIGGAYRFSPPSRGGRGGASFLQALSCERWAGGCPSGASFAYAMFAAREGQPPARYSPPHGLPFTASRPPHLPPFRQGGGRASGGHACPPNIKCGWCWLGLLSPAGADARPAGGARSRGLLWLPPRQIQAERGGTAGRTASLFSIPTARPKKSPLRGLPRRPYFALLGVEV